jgi:hypothetical protein
VPSENALVFEGHEALSNRPNFKYSGSGLHVVLRGWGRRHFSVLPQGRIDVGSRAGTLNGWGGSLMSLTLPFAASCLTVPLHCAFLSSARTAVSSPK